MRKSKRNILFTFDYELFLGRRSGYATPCIIGTTFSVVESMHQYHVKGIFFVDTLYLCRLYESKNQKCKCDLSLISKQLNTLLGQGHFIFPHIHSHWLDAKYLDDLNQWELTDISKYRVASLPDNLIGKVFEDSFQILNTILDKKSMHYELDSYRAGGWSIQPFSSFVKEFKRYNIKNDFSVIPGFMADTSAQQYDFIKAPAKPVYRFETDVLKEDTNGSFKEYTISAVHLSSFVRLREKILRKWLFKKGDKGGFGKGESLATLKVNSVVNRGETISIEHLSQPKLSDYLDYVNKNEYMQFISHPKMFSNHNLKVFNQFLKSVTSDYEVESDYRKIGETFPTC